MANKINKIISYSSISDSIYYSVIVISEVIKQLEELSELTNHHNLIINPGINKILGVLFIAPTTKLESSFTKHLTIVYRNLRLVTDHFITIKLLARYLTEEV